MIMDSLHFQIEAFNFKIPSSFVFIVIVEERLKSESL